MILLIILSIVRLVRCKGPIACQGVVCGKPVASISRPLRPPPPSSDEPVFAGLRACRGARGERRPALLCALERACGC